MALAERNTVLIEQLVNTFHTRHAETNKGSDLALINALNSHHQSAVDKFVVFGKLEGLIEKFDILGYGNLAEALQQCIEDRHLNSFKWSPELLSLLLELSEHPTNSAQIQGVSYAPITKPENDSPRVGTWIDLQWRGTDDLVDYDAHSSESDVVKDDSTSAKIYRLSNSTSLSDLSMDDLAARQNIPDAEGGIEIDPTLCEPDHLSGSHGDTLEIDILRQALHMLQGIPSDLFILTSTNVKAEWSSASLLTRLSSTTWYSILDNYAQIGSTLQALRTFVSDIHRTSTVQSFAASVSQEIHDFGVDVGRLESTLFSSGGDVHVSILSSLVHLDYAHKVPLFFRQIIHDLDFTSKDISIRIVDSLYEKVCGAQNDVDDSFRSRIRAAFYQCLQTYLKSVHMWARNGEIDHDEHHFFVTRSVEDQPLSRFWFEKFTLHQLHDKIVTPNCLEPLITKLFYMGKEVAFFRELGITKKTEPSFCKIPDIGVLAESHVQKHHGSIPFSACIQESLKAWARLHDFGMSQQLCHLLLYDCGGWRVAHAISILYLAENIQVYEEIASHIWAGLGSASGKHDFNAIAITHRVRQSLASVNTFAASTVKVCWSTSDHRTPGGLLQSLSCLDVLIEYPDAIKNIIRPGSLFLYQRVLILLHQLSYCSRGLTQILPRYSMGSSDAVAATHVYQLKQPRGKASFVLLRMKLTWFLNVIEDHFVNFVIDPLRARFASQWNKADDINKLLQAHEDFLQLLTSELFQCDVDVSIRNTLLSILELTLSLQSVGFRLEVVPATTSYTIDKRIGIWDECWGSSEGFNPASGRDLVSLNDRFDVLLDLFVYEVHEKARRCKSEKLLVLVKRLACC